MVAWSMEWTWTPQTGPEPCGEAGMFQNWIVEVTAQFCEFTKSRETVHLTRANFMYTSIHPGSLSRLAGLSLHLLLTGRQG